jgi:predicted GH43/DUF377 family glycosyl hydrolase
MDRIDGMKVRRSGILIEPDASRVLIRPFSPGGPERVASIVSRIMALSEGAVEQQLSQLLTEFGGRHHRLDAFFLERFEQMSRYVLTEQPMSGARQMLIGAAFTHEYSLESAALFNPSMVWHPDQSGLPNSSRRFILSLRATGEGHISSVTFRSGVIDAQHNIKLDRPTPFVSPQQSVSHPAFDKGLFEVNLGALGLVDDFAAAVMDGLSDPFTLAELKAGIDHLLHQRDQSSDNRSTAEAALLLADSNYEVVFSSEQELSERVIFPSSPAERNGIEDARFVAFLDGDGSTIYYATYTAYDGTAISPQLLETRDFRRFRIRTLHGPAIENKGLALFPRKINGLYAMLSRQDNENIFLMFSDHLHFWAANEILLKPNFPWESIQIGNCGSPVETDAGWLVLSHGVGPMRKYAIGAFLLDLDDPSRVIGRLKEPLLAPNEDEREGYVPNVVYSCGGQIHRGELIIPYGVSDCASSFASVNLNDLLSELTA